MEALVLRVRPAGEADLRVSLLANDGRRIYAYARGAREATSKLRAGIQPLTVSDIGIISGRRRMLAKSTVPVFMFPELKRHPVGQAVAVFVSTILEPNSDTMPDVRLYADTTKRLRDLHTAILAGESTGLIVRRTLALWIRLLEGVGFMPEFRDEMALDGRARAQLIQRRIPTEPEDIRALALFLTRHTENHFTDAHKEIVWATARFLMPRNVTFGTI